MADTRSNHDPAPKGLSQWPTWLGIGLMALLARLPWPLQRGLGRAAGAVLHVLFRSRRRIAERNIALCYPQLDAAAQAALVRASFASLGIGLFEFARAWWGSVEPMRRGLRVEGLEHLAAARAGGRGVIVISAHFTTLEMAGRLMCDYAPLAGMYRPHDQGAMEWAVKRGRLRYAAAMFTRDELRPAMKHLKQGGLLWFAPDQDTRRGESVYVPFFGIPAATLTATPDLAARGNAVVLPFWFHRTPDGRYRLRVEPQWDGWPSGDAAADAARYMAELEQVVRRNPEQYLWVHRRFKTRPPGEKGVYS